MSGYRGQHHPRTDGWCEHVWANRQRKYVRCDYALCYSEALGAINSRALTGYAVGTDWADGFRQGWLAAHEAVMALAAK